MTVGLTLVTGANGWIGARLVEKLQDSGIPVLAVGRKDIDLANSDATRQFLLDRRPSTIVHLAASLTRGETADARLRQWNDTVQSGRNILSNAKEAGVSRVIAAGSVEELGDQAGLLATDLPPRPKTSYGLAKSLVFELARFHAQVDHLSVDWFRPTTVYGPGQTGTMLIPTAFASAVSGEVREFTDGTQRRDFLFVDDLITWLSAAANPDRPLTPGELHVYHLGSGESVPVRVVLEHIASGFPGADFRLGRIPRRPHEPDDQYAPPYDVTTDSSRPMWHPRIRWGEGLDQTAEWWKGI